jgi:hypothetical protein
VLERIIPYISNKRALKDAARLVNVNAAVKA